MSTLSRNHIELRDVVDSFLGSEGIVGSSWDAEYIATAVNSAANFETDESQLMLDSTVLKKAYSSGDERHVVELGKGGAAILITKKKVTLPNSKKKEWKMWIGRYRNKEAALTENRRANPIRSNVKLNDTMKTKLTAFLEKQKEKKAKGGKNKKKDTAKAAAKEQPPVTPEETLEEKQQRELEERAVHLAAVRKRAARLVKEATGLNEKLAKVRQEMHEMQAEIKTELGEYSTLPNPIQVDGGGGKTLYYLLDGRTGMLPYDDQGAIFNSDIESNFTPLPEDYGDTEKNISNRTKRKYTSVSHGSSQYWIPPGVTPQAKNKQGNKEEAYTSMWNLEALFSGQQTAFDWDALRYAAAFNAQGYGASDEATEMIISGWTKTLLTQLGVEVSAEGIAKGLPSSSTLVRAEAELAAECVMVILEEIRNDKAQHFALITDHGKRSGLEHFVKILVWAGWKDAKKKDEKAIKKSLELFTGLDGFEVTAITGDAGGGAAVQNLLPELVRLGVVPGDTVKINCLMHALNKCLEIAVQDTFGTQGRGKRTPFQLLYVFSHLWKAIKEEGGSKKDGKRYLDEIYSRATDKLMNDSEWQTEAETKFPQAYEQFLDKLEALEDIDDEDEDSTSLDDLVAFVTTTPSNIQDPVFSRWKSVLSTANVVTQYWPQVYFVAVTVLQSNNDGSYLYTLAATLLSLMNERHKVESPSTTGKETMSDENEAAEENYSYDNDIDPATLSVSPPSETPTFYAMLLFFCAFGKTYFNDMFNWTMKDDPKLGSGSFGQTSRLCVERCYIMHVLLKELEGGGWKNRPEFQLYKDAIEKIGKESSENSSEVGKGFFEKASEVFFQRFRFVFEKHVVPCWTSDTILHYLLGGNVTLANEFARWLVDCKEMQGHAADSDESDNEDEGSDFIFERYHLDMGADHFCHQAYRHVMIYSDDCMEYLTAEADPNMILGGRFVTKHWDLIEKMGESPTDINLLDDSTWGGTNFSTLRDAIWNEISIHASHQQRCENFVQMAALVSKTNVVSFACIWKNDQHGRINCM